MSPTSRPTSTARSSSRSCARCATRCSRRRPTSRARCRARSARPKPSSTRRSKPPRKILRRKRRPGKPSLRKPSRDERSGKFHLASHRAAPAPDPRRKRGPGPDGGAAGVARRGPDLRSARAAADALAARGDQDDRDRRHHAVRRAPEGDRACRVHARAALRPVSGVGVRRPGSVREREEARFADRGREHAAVLRRHGVLLLLRLRQGICLHQQLRADIDHAGARHRGLPELRDDDVPRLRRDVRDPDHRRDPGARRRGQRREADRHPALRRARLLGRGGDRDAARRGVDAGALHPHAATLRSRHFLRALRAQARRGARRPGVGKGNLIFNKGEIMRYRLSLAAAAALLVAGNAFAQLLTEKKFFTLPQYTTMGGKTIKNVRIGYETYGKLNGRGDNAIFVAHFFSGTSHAAGRYKPDEKAAGYWDTIIGPGKAIDTDKYFVVSADTLVNLNVKSPMVGTV